MILNSPAFKHQHPIPMAYTGEGEDISPVMEWSDVPADTKSFVLICDDPDAPCLVEKEHTFVHWLIYNIPGNVRSLPPALPANELRLTDPVSLEQGSNSFGKVGYRGPMPPVNSGLHHYVFTLYALDQELKLRPALTQSRVKKAMEGHVLAIAKVVGLYERKAHSEKPRPSEQSV